MGRAILFDMDGVIVHSERLWERYEPPYLRRILGADMAEAIGSSLGLSIGQIYEKAAALGYRGSRDTMFEGYRSISETLYREAPITPGIDDLIGTLRNEFSLALVSSSPMRDIRAVLDRLTHRDAFDYVESVNDHPTLRPKPAPDGYEQAMRNLEVSPDRTIIIEDSPTGIAAAVASGATVIRFATYIPDAEKLNAHAVAQSTDDLVRQIRYFANSALK